MVDARRPWWMGLAALLFALVLSACGQDANPFLLGGIQVNESDLDHWLATLEASGLNTVSVTDYSHQGDWNSENLWYDPEDLPGITGEIRAAKERGLKVVLIARLALDHAFEANRYLWHGMIMPDRDEQLDEWFRRYREFVLVWAEIAEREGVDVFLIGSELNALTSTIPVDEVPVLEEYFLNREKQAERRELALADAERAGRTGEWTSPEGEHGSLGDYLDDRIAVERQWAEQVAYGGGPGAVEEINRRRARLESEWRRLIAETRGVYGGLLGYAANFDQYPMVGFWDALDVMGINAYFKLRDRLVSGGDEALYPLLVEGWSGVLGGIDAFRRTQGLGDMPVIFSEIGYTYRANSTLEPWADDGFALIRDPAAGQGDERPPETLIVWREQPVDHRERALAVEALHEAHGGLEDGFLSGLLYWKLSTLPGHKDIESFVLILDEGEEDPLLPALLRFRDLPGPWRAPPGPG
jgi:hypothetical protein